MSCLSMIVAVANNGVIGVNNTLPWHLPEDLKRFRALTMGHHIVMGRKTYESLGRLLPGRITVVVTRNTDYQVEGAEIVHSLEQALRFCTHDEELFLIGGAQLYQEGLQHVQKLYITRVNIEVDGDAFLPDIDFNAWTLTEKKDHQSTSGLSYSDLTYQRK